MNGRAVRIGMITPSSNTVLEPVTTAMLAGVANVTAHFARFKVTEIALSEHSVGQFDDSEILRAADLLADARVDVIVWNGTSASWLGLERDERLVERIEAATGIKACTCVLAFQEIIQRTRIERIGLVTPYTGNVQDRIKECWGARGLQVHAERHLGIRDNFAFAQATEPQLDAMIRAVAGEKAQAVTIVCTNVNGARLAARLEVELDVPIYDSVAVTPWECLQEAGVPPDRSRRRGRPFGELA